MSGSYQGNSEVNLTLHDRARTIPKTALMETDLSKSGEEAVHVCDTNGRTVLGPAV